ncbi:MAG: GNAT family N-acetyltransferase [Haloferula sp.]
MNKASVRKIESADVPEVLAMIRELAVFEKLEDVLVATEDDLRESFFGERPAAGGLVAETAQGLVGYAIHFTTFSTFLGKPGLWLEDIYIRPAWRGAGVGKLLLKAVVAHARDMNYGRCEWCVLDWNQRAIDFYEAMGGKVLDEWRIVRMDRPRIESLGGE